MNRSAAVGCVSTWRVLGSSTPKDTFAKHLVLLSSTRLPVGDSCLDFRLVARNRIVSAIDRRS